MIRKSKEGEARQMSSKESNDNIKESKISQPIPEPLKIEHKLNLKEIVFAHLKAIEEGDWEKSLSFIADNYQAEGLVPFPISLFVKIGKKDALIMHKARKRALPDFKFNETVIGESEISVKLQINITGTHTGIIDYRGILRGIPVIQPTGKFVKLNPEYFEYFVKDDKIVKTVGNIPKNAGVKGLVKAVTE
jgi:hypothetical protein